MGEEATKRDDRPTREITVNEAREILQRYVNGAHNFPGDKPRMSIPARPEVDDDLAMAKFIDQYDTLRAHTEAMAKQLEFLKDLMMESRGVAGYHLNGDEAPWDEFDEFLDPCAADAFRQAKIGSGE